MLQFTSVSLLVSLSVCPSVWLSVRLSVCPVCEGRNLDVNLGIILGVNLGMIFF